MSKEVNTSGNEPIGSEKALDESAICRDLVWFLFHGPTRNYKFRSVTYLRQHHDLRNSEICNILGIQPVDLEFILNNSEDS